MIAPRRNRARTGRIVHLLASADRRGAEVFAVDLAARLDEEGYADEVLALAPGRPGAPALDVEVVPRSPVGGARRLRAAARAADLVIGHGSRGLPGGTVATLGTGTPFVYRSIGDITQWGATTTLRRTRVGVQLRRAAAVVALWPEAGRNIETHFGVDPGRVQVIPNSIRADRFGPATAAARGTARRALGLGPGPVVAVIGAHGPEKRIPLAVEAVGHLDDVQVVVAGDGPERPLVEAAAARLGDRAVVLGAVADVTEVYRAADVVLSTSRTEGQPGVLLEAAVSGLAVVATDVGGSRSVAGPHPVMVAGEAPAERIAAAVTEALAGPRPDDRQRAALRAEFDITPVAARWSALIAAVTTARVTTG